MIDIWGRSHRLCIDFLVTLEVEEAKGSTKNENDRDREREADEKQVSLEIVNSGWKGGIRIYEEVAERDSWLRKQWRESRQLQKDMFLKNGRILSNGGLLRIKLEYIYRERENNTKEKRGLCLHAWSWRHSAWKFSLYGFLVGTNLAGKMTETEWVQTVSFFSPNGQLFVGSFYELAPSYVDCRIIPSYSTNRPSPINFHILTYFEEVYVILVKLELMGF